MNFTFKAIAWSIWFFVIGPIVVWGIYGLLSEIEPASSTVKLASGVVPAGIYLGVTYLLERYLAN